MIPLSIPNISGNEWKYIKQCLDGGWISSSGSLVGTFETEFRKVTHAGFAVSCMNGTCGLHVALQIAGLGPQDEVIVPTLSFIAPVNAVRYRNAEPVFMDCDEYLNMDPQKLRHFVRKECTLTRQGLKNKKTKRIIKAIVPVHVFGNLCSMDEIMEVAKDAHLAVVEDAAEALGSRYTKGRYKGYFAGTIGDLGVYSFNANKIVTTGGGGMICTNNRTLAEKARYLINQAKDDPVRYVHNETGYNFSMTNIQAAMGVAQLERLGTFLLAKKKNYSLYKDKLRSVTGLRIMGIPAHTRPNYWFYSLIVDKDTFGLDREELMAKLSASGIQTRPLWYLNHLQAPYRKNQAYRIEKAAWFWERVLSLPCSTNLTEADINKVVGAIKKEKN